MVVKEGLFGRGGFPDRVKCSSHVISVMCDKTAQGANKQTSTAAALVPLSSIWTRGHRPFDVPGWSEPDPGEVFKCACCFPRVRYPAEEVTTGLPELRLLGPEVSGKGWLALLHPRWDSSPMFMVPSPDNSPHR